MTKIPVSELASLTAEKSGVSRESASLFIKELFSAVEEEISQGRSVTIDGFGTFTISDVVGEPVAFTPDETFAAEMNEEFSMFVPVELNDEVSVAALAEIDAEIEAETESNAEPETEVKPEAKIDTTAADEPAVNTVEMPAEQVSSASPEPSTVSECEVKNPDIISVHKPTELKDEHPTIALEEAPEADASHSIAEMETPVTVAQESLEEEDLPKIKADELERTSLENKPAEETETDSVDTTIPNPEAKSPENTSEKSEDANSKHSGMVTKHVIPESEVEYVVVRHKKSRFWIGLLLGLLIGFCLGIIAFISYLVQTLDIPVESILGY